MRDFSHILPQIRPELWRFWSSELCQRRPSRIVRPRAACCLWFWSWRNYCSKNMLRRFRWTQRSCSSWKGYQKSTWKRSRWQLLHRLNDENSQLNNNLTTRGKQRPTILMRRILPVSAMTAITATTAGAICHSMTGMMRDWVTSWTRDICPSIWCDLVYWIEWKLSCIWDDCLNKISDCGTSGKSWPNCGSCDQV